MPISAYHSLTATTPDNTSYEIRPSHWNSAHVLTVNLTGSEISGAFSNLNGISFGLNGGAITGSYTVPSTAGLLSAVNISAGTTSSNVASVTFSNSNGVSFGYDGTKITATVATNYAGTGTSATNASITLNTNGLAISVGAGGAFSAGASNVGNTSGNTGITGTRLILAGGNNITVSQGTDANGATITISGANAGGAQTGISGIADSAHTQTVGTVSFANSNGITFGLSTGANTGTITASYTVPTVTNSSWTVSDNATSATVALLAFTQSNGMTLSLSTSNNGHHTVIGSYTVPTVTNSSWTVSDNATSLTISRLAFTQSNGLTLSLSTGAGAATVIGSYTVPTVTNSSMTVSDAATSGTLARLAFTNLNGVTLSLSTGAGGSHTIVGSHNALTSQSNQAFSAQGGSSAFQTINFTNSNNVSFSNTGGSVWGSYALNVSATGGTSNALSGLTFKDSQGVSFGLSTGAGVGTITASVASQSNQTLGIYASSQTLGTTSSTYDARSLSLVGSGVVSVGWSNSSLVINAPAAGGDGVNVVSMATTTSGGATSGTTYSQSSGTIGLVAGSNITLQQSSNSIVIFGASGGAGGNMSLYANGNTTVSSSIGSIPPTSFSLGGYGGVSVGYSSTNTTGIGTVIVSAPATSSLVGTNGISVSSNGSTISIQPQFVSSYENLNPGLQGSQTLTFNAASISYAVGFQVPWPVSVSFIRFAGLMTTNSTTLATIASGSATGSAALYSTLNAVVYSLGVGGSSKSLQSVASGSGGFTMQQSISMSNSTQASYTLGFSGQAQGAGTTLTTQYSVSNTNYSFTTNQIATNFSSLRFIDVPFANSLTPGAYWLVLGLSTSSASAGNAAFAGMSNCNVRYSAHYGVSQVASAWGVMGSTDMTSGGLMMAGSFSTAGGGTTNSLPLSAISSNASNVRVYFQMMRSN